MAATQHGTPPTLVRTLTVSAVAALIVGLVVLAFAWPSVTSEPKDLPVGLVGDPAAAAGLEQASDGLLDLAEYDDRAAAVEAIERRDVYGAVILDPSAPEVLTATAANPQVAQSLQQLASRLQTQQGAEAGEQTPGPRATTPVKVTDVVPFSADDPRGAGMNAAALPLVLGGILGGVATSLAIGSKRQRLVGLIAYPILGGLLLAALLGTWLGALQGGYLIDAAAIALALAAIAMPIAGLRSLLGPAGIGLGAAVMMLIANPISGATLPPEFLVGSWGVIGQWFPPGAGAALLRNLSYFPDADSLQSWLVLAGWAIAGLVILGAAGLKHGPTRFGVDEDGSLDDPDRDAGGRPSEPQPAGAPAR